MIDQEHASFEAEAQGVCHTHEECEQMYCDLSTEIKAPVLAMLVEELAPARDEIVVLYNHDPKHWASPHHFFWGMAVRNLLRQKGFGEAYFSIHNLNDIYVPLVEEALKLKMKQEMLSS